MIAAFLQLDIIDEYQLGVQTTILGSSLPLFKSIRDTIERKRFKTKTFGFGVVAL